jgi:hypothetical protein
MDADESRIGSGTTASHLRSGYNGRSDLKSEIVNKGNELLALIYETFELTYPFAVGILGSVVTIAEGAAFIAAGVAASSTGGGAAVNIVTVPVGSAMIGAGALGVYLVWNAGVEVWNKHLYPLWKEFFK